MKKKKFTIDDELMDLNKFISANRYGKFYGNRVKQNETNKVKDVILQNIEALQPLKFPITLHYTWVTNNRRKDKDNIAFAKKFVQDGMVAAGLLPNDGWNEIEDFTDSFIVDKGHARVEVVIKEAK